MKKLVCKVCMHEWIPRIQDVSICPNCKSPKWNRPSVTYKKRKECYDQFRKAIADNEVVVGSECEICGSNAKIEGHHNDYGKPLEVNWVCRSCHKKVEKLMRRGNDFESCKKKIVQSKDTKKENISIYALSETVFKFGLIEAIEGMHKGDVLEYLCRLYFDYHCPECKTKLNPKRCTCKSPETI